MLLYFMYILMGFFLLIKGADFLVDGASSLAQKFRIPTMIIGLTIVAIGTSMPELIVSLTASLKGSSDMSIGNVVGSNIANLFFILGICSLIRPLKFQKETETVQNLITIFAVLVLLFFGNNNLHPVITRIEGSILLVFTIFFILYNINTAKKTFFEFDDTNKKNISLFQSFFAITLGIFALKVGGDVVVKYSSTIALILGVSEKIISITIVAFATSLPELLTSVNATIKGDTDMAIGNIIGSQIFNIFLIIGISALFSPIKYSLSYNFDICFLLIGTIIFAIIPYIEKKHYMTRFNGIIFTISYIIYLIYNVLKIL